MMEIPMFIVGGFVDSGKTTFILDAISKDGFDKRGRTLLILCEEGEVEISMDVANQHNTKVVVIDKQEELTAEYLSSLAKEYVPDRAIMEINCMWDLNHIFIPEEYQLSQVLSFIDFTTFTVYYNNMRQKFIDLIKLSDMVVFNRCVDFSALSTYQTNLKMVNGNCQYMVMDGDGNVKKAFEEPLPYDINAPIIEIKDDEFGRWYIDTFENPDRYRGKVVAFNALVVTSRKLPKDSFIAGRNVMTCCANDVQLYGHMCKNTLGVKVKNKSWIRIVARIEFEYSDEYQEEEGVLYPKSIEPIAPIQNPVLDLR